MKIPPQNWDLTPEEAMGVQRELAAKVVTDDDFDASTIRTVAGIDVSLSGGGQAAIAVLRYPELEPTETVTASVPITFPYVPGLLSFRETPLVLAALEKLTTAPDLLLVDGQGRAHPRRFGIACHLGILTGLPSIGVAKSVLCGKHEPVGEEPGSRQPLIHRKEVIGMALRTKLRTNPLIISVGHRIALETAVDLVEKCVRKYRLPEPTRAAHKASGSR